jgi:Zn-dependent protease with chaperone function
MKNYILAFGALVLLICVCVLVIHYETQQTLESVRQMARSELPNLVQEGLDDTLRAVGDKLPKVRDTTPNSGQNEPAPDSSGVDGILDKVRDTLKQPAGKPQLTKPARPADTIDDLFGKVRGVINSTEKATKPYVQLSISEERTLGRQIHEERIREYVVVKDSALYDRIDELAAPILRARQRRGIDYTFTVVKSRPDNINAFSSIGGYVYFHTAAIDFFETDAALQSVIGHEIGHVDLGHCAHAVGVAQSVWNAGGDFAAGMHAMFALPYSQVQEYEADEYGFRAQIAAGRTREQALEGPRQFARHHRLRGIGQPTKKKSDHSVLGTLIEDSNSYFRTHPYLDDRVKRLESLKIDPPPTN